jgi:SAM-dependent methyltransferase
MKSDYYKFLWRLGPVAFSRGIPYSRCAEYPAVIDQLHLTPHDRLLDVGSRYSPLPQVLAMRYGCDVVAVDPEGDFRERQLAMARKVPAAAKLVQDNRLDFLVADAGKLSYPDGHFSKISVISVLEHITEEGPVITELARVLAPGGMMVVSVPFDPWRDEPKYYRKGAYVTGSSEREDFYMRYYSEPNLQSRLIAPSGLDVASCTFIGEPGFNAHNLLFGNEGIHWAVRRIFMQPFAPLLAGLLIRELTPTQFRHKSRMYTADAAILVLTKPVL